MHPRLVLVQPRKTRPCLTERLLMGCKESKKKKKKEVCYDNSQSNQMFWYCTLHSEALIANSHKAYFNKFINNDDFWIQSACVGH